MKHPTPIDPREYAVYAPDKMGKTTIFRSDRVLVGLNAFEPGQEHELHAHADMDKVYSVIEGQGLFLLEGGETVPCLLYTSPSPRDRQKSRMPSSA